MARPTISSAICSGVASAVGMEHTLTPLRRTVTRSLMSMTSWSLWVMMITAQPLARISRRISKSRPVSWAVSTAVGSSRIMIRALRYRALTISTVCFSPIVIS